MADINKFFEERSDQGSRSVMGKHFHNAHLAKLQTEVNN